LSGTGVEAWQGGEGIRWRCEPRVFYGAQVSSKTVLFVAPAGHGHITPTLPLVAELVRRGHRVDYATGPAHADAVCDVGASWVALPPLEPFVPPARVGPEVVALWLRHFFAALGATYPVLHEHCIADRPDGVCYDATNWPARVVAKKLGIPAGRTVPNLAANDTYSQVDEQLTAGLGAEHPEMAALTDDIAAFAAQYNVELDFAATMDVTEALNLVFLPREFQPAGESFDARFRFLGPMLGDREQRASWSPPHPELPVLFISLGSIFTDHPEFYRTCLEAFGDGTWQVAMSIGQTDPACLGPLPPTVEVRPWFAQPAVLRRAAAFVTHAGMGSIMEALYYGVPLVTFPQMPEQVVNADRVEELGLGTRLDAQTLTVDTLRSAVGQVTSSPKIRANLDRMRMAAHHGGGAPSGAAAIEEYLSKT
jgi:MGT family glycosyltransferase